MLELLARRVCRHLGILLEEKTGPTRGGSLIQLFSFLFCDVLFLCWCADFQKLAAPVSTVGGQVSKLLAHHQRQQGRRKEAAIGGGI